MPLPSMPLWSPVLRVLVATRRSILAQATTRGFISTPAQSLVVCRRPFGRIAPPDAHQQLALIVIFFATSAPISWKKVQFQNCLTWCGWSINFLLETIELSPLKTLELKEQLHALLRSKKNQGLLIWATSLSLELRSWLAPLYADLHLPPGCMISVNARLWPAFLLALNAKAVLATAFHAAWLNTRKPQYAAHPTCLAWCPVTKQRGRAWQTPLPSKTSRADVEWLLQCFHFRQTWHARCKASQSWHVLKARKWA